MTIATKNTIKWRKSSDNFRFDENSEYDNEAWADTERTLKDTLKERLEIGNVKIERLHRVGKPVESTCMTIVASDPGINFVNNQLQKIKSPYFSAANFNVIAKKLNEGFFSFLYQEA